MVTTPLPAVPGVIKFNVGGTCGVTKWENVLHWGYTGGPPSGANLNAASGALLTAWSTNFAALMGVDCALTTVTAVDLSSSSGASGENAGVTSGTRTGGPVPASSAVIVSKQIARRYRGGHPRSYIVAGTDTDLDDASHWTSALIAGVDGGYSAVQTAMDTLVEGATTLTTEVTVSYFTALARRAVPLVEPVTGINVRLRIGTQRRRIGK